MMKKFSDVSTVDQIMKDCIRYRECLHSTHHKATYCRNSEAASKIAYSLE